MAFTSWTSLSAVTKGYVQSFLLFVKGSGVDTNIYAVEVGQQLMASSLPVVIASDQSAIPVTGTITANNPSVAPTGAAVPADATMVGGTDGTNLRAIKVSTAGVVSVDGSAVTQPVSAASLPLPTGAATEATLAKIPLAQASTTSGQSGSLIQGAVTSAAPTYTTAQTNPLSLTTAGALRVDASGSTQPVSGTVTANAGTGTFTVALSTSTAAFQAEGSVAFGSVTNAYQTIFTPSASTKILQMRNNTDASISVSFDAGTTLNYVLDAGDQVSLDLLTNQLIMSTTAIQIKYTVGAPTLGSVRVNGCH